MRRVMNACLFVAFMFICSISAFAGQIDIQSVTIENWQDTRTNVELWLFVDQPFIRSDGRPVLSGGPGNKIAFQRVTCTVNTVNKTITIPEFQLWSTTDGLDIDTAQYSAYFFTDKAVQVKPYENFSDGFRVPPIIASSSGCAPAGSCAIWADIRAYNFSKIITNNPTVYTKDEINRIVAAIQEALEGVTSGAPGRRYSRN